MAGWTFLTNHGIVLVCIAHDPGVRLREIAARVGITERTAHAIVTDLAAAGYVIKQREGRRNRYQIRADLPLRQPLGRQPTIGEVLDVLVVKREFHGEGLDRRAWPPRSTAGAQRCSPLRPHRRRRLHDTLHVHGGRRSILGALYWLGRTRSRSGTVAIRNVSRIDASQGRNYRSPPRTLIVSELGHGDEASTSAVPHRFRPTRLFPAIGTARLELATPCSQRTFGGRRWS